MSAGHPLVVNDLRLGLRLEYWCDDHWVTAALRAVDDGFDTAGEGIRIAVALDPADAGYGYRLTVTADFPTRVRFILTLAEGRDIFHLIPCNIHGDNNLALTGPGEYPHLTAQYADDPFCAPLWEFRADRAALPVSILCHAGGAVGISIDPYSEQDPDRVTLNDRGFIRNGVIAALPASFGVSLGYGNDPGTFVEKRWLGEPTCHLFREATATGRIFAVPGDRRAAHRIIRELYARHREVPTYERGLKEAIAAVMDAWLHVNWGPVSTLGGREYYRNGGLDVDVEGPADCGRYGVMTERFCPSDGLVTEKNRDGSPYSIWRCYNG